MPYGRVDDSDIHRYSPSALGAHFGHELVSVVPSFAVSRRVGVPPAAGNSQIDYDGLSYETPVPVCPLQAAAATDQLDATDVLARANAIQLPSGENDG